MDDGRELSQQLSPAVAEYLAMRFFNEPVHYRPMRGQGRQRLFLVNIHQPGVALDISGENGCKLSF